MVERISWKKYFIFACQLLVLYSILVVAKAPHFLLHRLVLLQYAWRNVSWIGRMSSTWDNSSDEIQNQMQNYSNFCFFVAFCWCKKHENIWEGRNARKILTEGKCEMLQSAKGNTTKIPLTMKYQWSSRKEERKKCSANRSAHNNSGRITEKASYTAKKLDSFFRGTLAIAGDECLPKYFWERTNEFHVSEWEK